MVGNYDSNDYYYNRLKNYVCILNLEEKVYFSGHVSFGDILAYYSVADLFLCMREHEGFCVPLVEAMLFDLPIIAFNSCAIPDTLGGASLLLKEKNYLEISGLMNNLFNNKESLLY